MNRIIAYPLMTVLSIGVAGQMVMAQFSSSKLDQKLAALELNKVIKIAQTHREIDEKTALNLVWKLPLVQRKAKEIERLSKKTIKVSAIIDSVPNPSQSYYTVRVFEDDPTNHNYTIYWFRVFSSNGAIEALDVVENKYVSLDEWREQIRRRR